MHELSLATEIYRTCRATIDARGPGRLDSARVAIGELAAVEPELLVYAWEAVVSGGRDAAARLEVEWHPAQQTCATCGGPVQVAGGDELDVIDLTYTPDDEEAAK